MECERSQTRLRDLCVNLSANSLLCRRHQRPQRESRHFFFYPIKTKMLLCYCSCFCQNSQAEALLLFIPRATHTSSVTSNHVRQTAVIYTQTAAGGVRGGGGEGVSKEDRLWLFVCRAAINVANSHYRKTRTPTGGKKKKNPLR